MNRRVSFAALLLTACASAKLITAPDNAGEPNAKKGASHPGVVRYSSDGLDVQIENRRSDAYDVMTKACNGKFHIDAEGDRLENGAVVSSESGSASSESSYWYIQFSCSAP